MYLHVPTGINEKQLDSICNYLQQKADYASLKEIGINVGLKITPYLRGLVEYLERENYVIKVLGNSPKNRKVYLYLLKEYLDE